MRPVYRDGGETLLTGHPKGLYRLFFIEMWERLAFYTMVGILLLYTIDTESGGLGLSKVVGNEIYGLYLAFVYFTPYLGGIAADRFLGYRKAVFVGGCFFALGFFLMSVFSPIAFVSGLVCLCIGNGFFKPNISVMVGNLYEPGDPKRDSGFNIFYMGINIGAFIAPIVASTVRNELGWLWVFRTAGFGMLIGLAVLLASWSALAEADRRPEPDPEDTPFSEILTKILLPALVFGASGYLLATFVFPPAWSALVRPAVVGFLTGMLPIVVFFLRLVKNANEDERPGLGALLPVYLAGGTFFMVLHLNGSAMTTWAKENTDRRVDFAPEMFQEPAYPAYYDNAGPEEPRPNRRSLLAVSDPKIAAMFGVRRIDDAALKKIVEEGGGDVGIRELDPKEVDPAFDRLAFDVYDQVVVAVSTDSHGHSEITVTPAVGAKKLRRVALVRNVGGEEIPLFVDTATRVENMYGGYEAKHGKPPEELAPGEYMKIPNTELFQTINPGFVVLFTPIVVWFFAMMTRWGRAISTARKIFYGMCLTALALLLMAGAAFVSDDGGTKASLLWLVGFYAIITVGELCLSPMALSLVTKLSPKRLVGLTMGGWFMATAFGNNFSGFFGGLQGSMAPTTFFLTLAGLVAAVAAFVYMLLPRLDAAIKRYGA